MFLEIYKDTKELGDAEARRIAALLKKKPDALLCLAAGQSANFATVKTAMTVFL